LLKIPGLDRLVLRKIRKSLLAAFGNNFTVGVIIGGAALNREVENLLKRMKFPYTVGYGMTECGPIISYRDKDEYVKYSCGTNVGSVDIRIDSSNPYRVLGEIQVKGDATMLGYYKNEEATAAAFTDDGWFRTGDVGYEDSDGYFYITGRMKSVIVLENGKNVFPEEIEEYLDGIEEISECAVIGREDGEVVNLTALIYPDITKYPEGTSMKDIQADIERKINAMNKTLPTYKHVKVVELRAVPFEKTSSRKIKRHLLK
jgi:long-chain acyl-CoA synthetase